MPDIATLAQQLQDTAFGTALAESRYAFPVVEGLHLIGLSLSVGLIALIDLRLVGWFLRAVPLADVLRPLRPWVLAGFVVTFASGLALFVAEAPTVILSPALPPKLLFIFLAGCNALYFEWRLQRSVRPGAAALAPGFLRRAGWASLGLWTLVVTAGRLIPYLPH